MMVSVMLGHWPVSRILTYTPQGHIAITPTRYMFQRPRRASVDRENKPQLLNRLSRIEGQVRGVSQMIKDDRYCIDVLTQLQAVRAALARVEMEMLKDHLGHCIEGAIVSGDKEEQRRKSAELIELLGRATR